MPARPWPLQSPEATREKSAANGTSKPSRILVVDDDEVVRRLLCRFLAEEGYDLIEAADGATALAKVASMLPDLVLLDLRLPRIDGIDVCRRIKASPPEVAVLFVTAVSDPVDQVRCLDAGAEDFGSKPVQRAILLARVRTQLRLKHLHDEIRAAHRESERQVQRLRAVEKMRDNLVHMIVHDLKNPLAGLGVGVELLQGLSQDSASNAGQTTLNNMAACTARLRSMVQNILDVSRMEETGINLEVSAFSMDGVVAALLSYSARQAAREQEVRLTVNVAKDLPPVVADMNLVARVIENLVSNAIHWTDEGGEVQIDVEPREEGGFRVTISDRGPGVPEDQCHTIFDKFVRADGRNAANMNHGLGLTFCRMTINAHGGVIWVEPREGGGSHFRFEIPLLALPAEREEASAVDAHAHR